MAKTFDEEQREARVNLIPTDAPRAPVQGESASGSDLERNLQAASTVAPGAGPALGMAFRTAGRAGQALGASDRVAGAAPYVAPALGALGLAAASAPAVAPAQAAAVDATKPALPGAPSAGGAIADSSTQSDVQRGGGNVPGITPTPVGGAPGAFKTTANGKTLYSDGNAAADASLMARGVPTAGAMAAADNLSARNDGTQAALGARFAQEVAGAQAVNRAGAANAQRVENDMEREQLLKFATSTPSRSRAAGAMGLIANSASTQASERTAEAQLGFRGQELAQTQATAAARNQVDQARLGLDSRKAGLDANAQQQLLAAQQAVTNATTPEARAAAEDNLRAIQGRYEKTIPNRFTVVPGGKDELGNVSPSSVLNNQTGEFVQQPGRAAAGGPSPDAVAFLKQNPGMAAQYDAKFGAGAAARVLQK